MIPSEASMESWLREGPPRGFESSLGRGPRDFAKPVGLARRRLIVSLGMRSLLSIPPPVFRPKAESSAFGGQHRWWDEFAAS